MKQLKRLLLAAVYFCLAAVIGINGILLVKRLVYKEELPSFLGYSMVTVLSGSMEPEFSPGDLLIIKKQKSYAPGEIVTYQEQGSFITHRIVEIAENTVVTKGDANDAPDGTRLVLADIYGKVCLMVPGLGQLVLFFKSTLGILVLIIMFLALMEFSFWNEKRCRKEERPEAQG